MFFKKINKFIAIFLILLATISCATKIRNFEKYQTQLIPKSQFIPNTEEYNQKLPRVLVFQLEENNIEIATQSELGLSLAKNIENILSQNNLAEIVDRSIGIKLKEEISLAEINNNSSYDGPKISDYAIVGTISNATFSSTYKAEKNKYNKNTGTYNYTPPQFTYISQVNGNIKILEVPSLETVKIIEFNGEETESENVQKSGGLNIGLISIGGKESESRKRNDGLVRRAGKNALFNISEKLQNVFAKIGYIIEKRAYKNKAIFKINLGKDDGIKEGDHFNIIAKYQIQNPLTGEEEIEEKIVATGRVSNKIDPKNSWIIIKNKENINKIRLGDKLQIFYKESFSKKHSSTFKSIGKILEVSADIAEIYLDNTSKK